MTKIIVCKWLFNKQKQKNNSTFTFNPFIVTSVDKKHHNKSWFKCLIKHEEIHLRQQKYWFPIFWILRWKLDINFRIKVETEAMIVQIQCLKRMGITINKDFYINYMRKRYGMSLKQAVNIILEVL